MVGLHPTSDLVAVAWLGSVPGLTNTQVATTLPKATSWPNNEFVTVTVVGGTPDYWINIGKPVVQVDCYAVRPGSGKPLWSRANQMAELIRLATHDRRNMMRVLQLGSGVDEYAGANVMQASFASEPRRIYGDAGDYARYQFDLEMTWRELNLSYP